MRSNVIWIGLWLLAACAANPAPVPLVGTAGDLTSLAGEWSGQYSAIETGRSGIVTFSLQAGRDTAFGDVIMMPEQASGRWTEPTAPGVTARYAPTAVAIQFVRVRGNEVSGSIRPYVSPVCDCFLTTTFRGVLRGDRIDGDFVSRDGDNGLILQHGTWWVERDTP
jgi:hypothetical protein